MGALEQLIEQAILKHSRKLLIKQVLSGVARNVGELTCDVEREDAPTLFDVRLNAVNDTLNSHFTVYPGEGTPVLVAVIENMKTEAVVLSCSEIEKVKIKTGSTEFELDKDGVLITRENESLQQVLSDLVAEVQKIIVVVGTSPNVVALEEIKTRLNKILK